MLYLVALCFASSALAQDNYEIQVYGAETLEPGSTMIELHSNFAVDGSKVPVDGTQPTNHAVHETVEITQPGTRWVDLVDRSLYGWLTDVAWKDLPHLPILAPG